MNNLFKPIYYFHYKAFIFYNNVRNENPSMAFWSSQLLFGFIMFSHIGAGIGIYDISHEIDLSDKYVFLENPSLIIGGILGIIVIAPIYFLMYWGRDWRKIFEHIKESDSSPVLGGIIVLVYIVFSLVFFFYIAAIKFG